MQPTVNIPPQVLERSAFINKLACDKKHILVTCFPKSGSTWLSAIIGQLPGYSKVDLVPWYDRREQELAFEKLILYHEINYVAQHHCRLSMTTGNWLAAFSINPVILVRNIFDCVISVKDHIEKGEKEDSSNKFWPMAYIPDAYFRWSDPEKFDFIIDMIVPWYFNFFVGWQYFVGKRVWVNYEGLLANPMATLKKISDEFNLGLNELEINHALEKASQMPTRMNRAKAGRGDALTRIQKDKIYRFSSYYPSQDFSLIGL